MKFANPAERDEFIEKNRGLAVAYAVRVHRGRKWKFTRSGINDLIQAATVGMIVAVDRHDTDRSEFSTTAHHWMRKEIQRLYVAAEPILSCPAGLGGNCSEETKRAYGVHVRSIRRPALFDEHLIGPREFDAIDLRHDVADAIGALDVQHRRCLMAFLGRGGDIRGLAKKLGVTRSRVYQIKDEAVEMVRRRLAAYGGAA